MSEVEARGSAREQEMNGFLEPHPGTQPAYLHRPYRSTLKRAPLEAPIALPAGISELSGPSLTASAIAPDAFDLTAGHGGAPIGERIYISGRVVDENGRPVPHTLVEVWQ